MAIGEWFAQIYPTGGGKSHDPVYFSDFKTTLAFVQAFRSESSGDQLRVYVPASATDKERQELIDTGAIIG